MDRSKNTAQDDVKAYVALLDKNIKLITLLRTELHKTLDDVEIIPRTSRLAPKECKEWTERLVSFAENRSRTAKDLEVLIGYVELIATINLLIENTEAMQVLIKENFALQATMIARNSIEILLRIIIQVDYYKSANYDPTKIMKLKIENKQDLIKYLQKKAAKNKVKFKKLEDEAFKIVKEMFPHKKNIFYSFAYELEKVYGELCGFTHPEVQLKDRFVRVELSSASSIKNDLYSLHPVRDYSATIILMIRIFVCNALAVRLTIELLKSIIKDENYDKNIINVDKAYNDFYSFYYELRKKNPKEISAELI